MNLILTAQAGEDLDGVRDSGDRERIVKKIDSISEKVGAGVYSAEQATEKRLGKGWSPTL